VVNDVCARCNNALLNVLDDYFCQLYDKYFVEAQGFDASVTFEYDYSLLTRVLLKIAYNSARSAGSDHDHLRALRSYISVGEPIPSQVAVFAELVSPTVVSDAGSTSGSRVVLPTDFYRSAITKLLTPHGNDVYTRIVAVGSFYFHLVLPARTLMNSEFEHAASELGTFIPGVVQLLPTMTNVTLTTSPQDAISSIAPHIQKHRDTYREYFRRKKS
jgi:hypothetical protein